MPVTPDKNVEKTAQDWVRDLRFSNQVNMQTMGVDTDRVTPQLLLASSNKLLGISRGQQEGDPKDSLQFQRVYGPVEYFAERIQKDGGSVARQMLWKATNKGNLDFIGAGSLQPHVNAVFHESNLSQFVDNSTPFESVDTSQKVTRVGEGGISDGDAAPIEMRLVQPSYYGFVDPCRCYSQDTQIYTKEGWISVKDMTQETEFATLVDGKPQWNKPTSVTRYKYQGKMYGYDSQDIQYLVSPEHKMWVSKQTTLKRINKKRIKGWTEYRKIPIEKVHGKYCRVLSAVNSPMEVDETQKWFYLPAVESTLGGKKLTKNIQKVDIVDFAAFMGWYLSQGSYSITQNWPADKGLKYVVRISQSPTLHPEFYEEIRELIQRLPFGAHPKKAEDKKIGMSLTINRKQLCLYCKQFGDSFQKFIPEWIFTAPTKARWAFVDAILKGDGSEQRHLNTVSRKLAYDFQRLLFQLGQSVRVTRKKQKYISTVTGKQAQDIYTVVWHKTEQLQLFPSSPNRKRKVKSGRGYYTQDYSGYIYCPTVPGGLVYVRRNNASFGIWLGNTAQRDPGITGYLTKNAMKGTDGKLYQKFINMHTGKIQLVDSQTVAKSIVTTDEYLDNSDSYVYAIGGPKGIRVVKRSDVDFILPNSDDAFSASANTVPMISGIKAMRLLMGCHHPETPMAVVDSQGYTHIVPAKRLSQMGDIYVLGCDKKGNDQLYPVRKIITRVPERKSKFKKVILSSGRVLITSMQHKWWIYQNGFNLVEAKDLQKGMIVPRSLFTSMPVRPTKVMGVPVTREICVFLGRVIRSLRPTSYSYRVDFVVDPDREVDQEKDILTAIQQLGIKNCNMFHSRGIHAVTIKDPVFQDWVDQNVGKLPEERRIPSEVLSLPQGYTSIFLDSYYKDLQTLGEDTQGDTWLISIANPALRDSLSFMLNKIYTDTKYRDCTKKKTIHRALQLFPAKTSMGDIVLQKITKVLDVSAPAVMIDVDCDDNVYATANGIITHNSKYISQAVPLQEREAPLVRSLDAQTGVDMPTKAGKLLGTQWAPKAGMVKAVREDRIDMLYDDGTTGSVPLYKNFPANAKGWLTNYPKVKAGDKVAEGQLLATSNYTDDNGVLAMGRNLRIGYMSYHGGTYEDACTISQSAAKKMGYTTMYKTSMDKEKSIRTAKKLYTTWKPGQYTKEQLDNIGDDGVVKVGATINKGDPVILGIRTTEPSPGTLGKRILTDVTQVWEHANPGTVTDVVNGKNGIKVFATVSSPLREGDKLSALFGNKGVVAQVLTDDKMPRDAKGRPLDILFDPLGIVSRTNPSQLMQAGLGKVAQKIGQPIVVPQFMPKGQSRLKFVKDLMKQHNVPWKEDVYDPDTGRTIKNVYTGVMYFLPLKHIADTKMSARGTAKYSAQGVPLGGGQQGSKKIGSLESAALVGHGVFDFLHDAKLIRGQQNSDFWRQVRSGQIPTVPGQPLAHKKFFAHLQASGMQIKRDNEGVTIFALSNKDVDELAGTRELKSTDTYQNKSFRPIDGGLFGTDIFGPQGDKWAYIQLDSPLPNPVMQEPLARLLNIPDREFQAIVRGKGSKEGLRNAVDMKKVLSKMDLQKETDKALAQLKASTKSKKDNALKRYVAIARMRDAGVRPQEYMLDRIPVLPPKFRPITSHGGLTMVADSNYLYSQLLNARDDLREAQGLPQEYKEQGLSNLYSKWKELVGLYDPSDVKLKSKNVKGLLKWALGTTPKFSSYMTKVLGSTVDTVGRGVIIPSTKIKLNQVGMPVQMAWNLYSPFVTRKLVQSGYSTVDALKLIKERKPVAFQALAEAVKERPVVLNRAPSLHKLSLVGLNVKLTTGHAIKVNPSIDPPLAADHDGDSVLNTTRIVLNIEDAKGVFGDFAKKGLDKSKSCCRLSMKAPKVGCHLNKGEIDNMFASDTKAKLIQCTMALSEIPRKEGSEVQKSETVTEWEPAFPVYVPTIDPATGEATLAEMAKISRHTGLKMFDCNLSISSSYGHVVTASEDHSLITLNPISLELEKTRPEDAKGRCVPRMFSTPVNHYTSCAKYITLDKQYPLSYEMGVFLGTMIGDGWVDANGYSFVACCDESFQKYIEEHFIPSQSMPFTKQAKLFKYATDEQRFSKDDKQRFSIYMEHKAHWVLKEKIGSGAYNKKIPWESMMGSPAHQIGVLVGLLATDGHIGVHKANTKKSSNKVVAYHTTSALLRDGIQDLCLRLGVKTYVTPYMGPHSKVTCYAISFSLEDIAKLKREHADLFILPVEHKEAALQMICSEINKGMQTSYDIVPFPKGIFCECCYAKVSEIAEHLVIGARKKGFIRRDAAKKIADRLEGADWKNYHDMSYIKTSDRTHHTPEEAKALVDKWISMVRNEEIGWEVVDSVTPSTCTEGWDCTVPGPYTFSLSTGTVVQDTVNLHVPVSQKAVRDVRQKMMPQRNLISLRKGKTLYKPQKAYTQGLYVATRMGQAKDIKVFPSVAEARKEYLKGNIDIDTPIVIKES